MLERIKPLNQGFFGSVWLERDVVFNELRAVKYVDKSLIPKDLEGWSQEARAMSEGDGEEHIVRIFGAELTPDGPKIIMEYLTGGSADDRWAGSPAPVRDALDTCIAACRAIETLHLRGVLHRDIKPANILFDGEGRVKVTDFGLARPTGRVIDASTINYVRHEAPELQHGAEETEQSDVYAMGVTLYRLLCGDDTLPALSPDELKDAAQQGTYPPRNAWPEHVPAGIRKAVERAIEPNPIQRFATMRDLRLALEQCVPVVSWSPGVHSNGTTTWNGTTDAGAVWAVTQLLDGKESSVEIAYSRRSTTSARRRMSLGRRAVTEAAARKHSARALQLISDGKERRLEARNE